LFDETLSSTGDAAYHCALIQAISRDIASTSKAIETDWQSAYAAELTHPDTQGPYRTQEEVLRAFFKTLTTGLQFTSDMRLERPMGTFERPRPTRAESWRAGRSKRNVGLSLTALRDLATRLSANDPAVADRIDESFETALTQLARLDDPVFAGVSDPAGRLKVEALPQSVDEIRAIIGTDLGPTLGVTAGFNALDGD